MSKIHMVAVICFMIASILYLFGGHRQSELVGLGVIVEIIGWIIGWIGWINEDDNRH